MPTSSSRFALALTGSILCLAGPSGPAQATADNSADDAQLTRLASCADSWYDWSREQPQRLQGFAQAFGERFAQVPKEPAFTPRAPLRLLGLPVLQAFPDSVGMGLGFSVRVKANFEDARLAMEKQLGRPMTCERSDGMMACELPLGEKRTALLMTPLQGRDSQSSLLGCYYFYQP
jgi:hypothetical protein